MSYDRAATEAYIRQAAKARGIDPDVAVRVAKSEGLAKGVYQSQIVKPGVGQEPSFGPFQLLVGGEGTGFPVGMGNDFVSQTGLDPRDPSTVNAQVDFALDNAAQNGWGAWYGAKAVGIGKRDGIGGNAAPQGTYTRDLNTGTSTMAGYPSTGLGGLGGLGGMMPEEEPAQGGIGGFLNSGNGSDLLQAIGMSLMSSPSNNALGGVATALPGLQARRDRADDRKQQMEERQLQRQAMMSALMSNGFSPDEAAAYASSPQAASVAAAGREEERSLAQSNRTLGYLRQAFPDIASQVDAGLPVSEAFKLASEERRKQMEGTKVSPEAQKIADREAAATANGLTPGTPEYRAYVLTGNMPSAERNVTAGDRLAIREADDMAFSAEQAGLTLQTAMGLSGDAYEGATAGARASIGNNLPDWMVPDFIASPEGAASTTKLNQAVTEGALQQMKSIFGGNPTEGERAILLEIQGSASQPKSVREDIYKRAMAAVERRRSFNVERSQDLRGGSYYDAERKAAGKSGKSPAGVSWSAE